MHPSFAGQQFFDLRHPDQAHDRPAVLGGQEARATALRAVNGPAAVGLLGDAAFSSSPMSGAGTGLALVGAYLLAGELAAAGWDPEAGFAAYERRMRSFVEANQEIGRLHSRSRDGSAPGAESSIDFDTEWFTELIERAINGVELPDYAGVPDSGASTGSSVRP